MYSFWSVAGTLTVTIEWKGNVLREMKLSERFRVESQRKDYPRALSDWIESDAGISRMQCVIFGFSRDKSRTNNMAPKRKQHCLACFLEKSQQ
jgi:hypothetical protein